jgi:hypothetical protein
MRVHMGGFRVDDFVATVEHLGLILAAVPLADGTIRLSRWRMPDAVTHASEIENLWTTHIGDDPDRLKQLATHIMERTSQRPLYATPFTTTR